MRVCGAESLAPDYVMPSVGVMENCDNLNNVRYAFCFLIAALGIYNNARVGGDSFDLYMSQE